MENTLSVNEKATLSKKEIIQYNSLSEGEKIIFTQSFRMNGKRETRGRHIKGCECDKCLAKKENKNQQNDNTNNSGNSSVSYSSVDNTINSTENNISNKENAITENDFSNKNSETEIAQFQAATEKTAEQTLEEELNEFKKAEQQHENKGEENKTGEPRPNNDPPQPSVRVDISQFVSGALFLLALDYCFPIILKYVVGYFNPKYKRIKPEGYAKLALTETEKKYLEPSAETIVKYIFADMHPLLAACFCISMVYGGKFAMLNTEKDFFEDETS